MYISLPLKLSNYKTTIEQLFKQKAATKKALRGFLASFWDGATPISLAVCRTPYEARILARAEIKHASVPEHPLLFLVDGTRHQKLKDLARKHGLWRPVEIYV